MAKRPTYKELQHRVEELEHILAETQGASSGREEHVHVQGKDRKPPELIFEELFDMDELQKFQDLFAEATGVACLITHTDGTPTTQPSNFCRLCSSIRQTEKGRARCIKSDEVLTEFSQEGLVIETCMSAGLWHAGAPIEVGGIHVGNWLIGQVRDDSLTEERIRKYAHEIGIDEAEMVEAFNEVPYMKKEQFAKVALMLHSFVNALSSSAFENYQKSVLIEEIRQTEKALKESETYMRTLIRTLPDLVWLKDAEGVYHFCNSKFESFFGAKEAFIIGKTDYDFVDKEQADLFRRNDLLAIAAGEPVKNEEEITFASDGHHEILEVIKTPVYREDNQLMGVLGIGRDITAYRQTEAERITNLKFLESMDRINRIIHRSNNFDQMLNSVLDEILAIFLCDRAYLLYPCNPDAAEWEVLFERNVPEYPGMFEHGIKLPMTPQVQKHASQLLATDQAVPFTAENGLNADEEPNKTFHIQSILSMALYPKSGDLWEFGIQQCSYPRIWTEEEKRLFQEIGRRIGDGITTFLANQELQKNEQFLNNIFENIPNMIIMKDANDLRFVKFNRAAEELLGYKREEMIGKNDYDFNPKALADFFIQKDRKVLDAKELVDFPEEAIRTKDNRQLIIHTKKIPLLDEKGRPQFLLGISEDITEKKQAERELKEVKERLQSFMNSATDAMSIYDANLCLIDTNQKALLYFPENMNPKDLIGRHISELIFNQDKDKNAEFERGLYTVLETGEPYSTENVYRVKDQSFWLNIRVFKVGDGLGVLTSDVTAQKKAEKQARETSERLQLFMNSATDAMTIYDEHFRLIDINQKALSYYSPEVNKEQVEGMLISEIVGSLNDVYGRDKYSEIAQTGTPYFLEKKFMIGNKELWFFIKIFKVGKGLGVVASDITLQKIAEREIQKVTARLQSFMDSAIDVMSVWDVNFSLQLINNAALAYFPNGTRKKDLYGKQISELGDFFKILSLEKKFTEVLNTGNPLFSEDMVFIDSKSFWFNVKIFKVGEGIGAIINNVTEKKKLEEELLQSQKIESIGRLAGGIAHDYNNMLGVIIGHTDLALQSVEPGDPLYDYLQEIMTAAERSAELTHQLLVFARKQTVAPVIIDLNTILPNMLKMLRALIGEHIELSWKPSDTIWSIRIDPSQVNQLLANLCVNARDAIQDTGTITIEAKNMVFDEEYCAYHPGAIPGDFVMLSVTDNGKGMDRETREKIFEPFFTTKDVGKGTGLGLATVYGIVKQNDGFINVYSEPGIGTAFKLFFPREIKGTEKEEEVAPRRIKLAKGNETVLLVEDEPVILNMAKLMLERIGYTVIAFPDPSKAIDFASNYQNIIHLLLTDVIMPGMNGSQLAKELNEMYPDMKCLFMSGYTDDLIAHHGVLENGVHFLQKPFSMQVLAEKVREALEK